MIDPPRGDRDLSICPERAFPYLINFLRAYTTFGYDEET